jgi:hypothetical protein
LALIGAAHTPERVAAWRLEGAALDEDAAATLVFAGGAITPPG